MLMMSHTFKKRVILYLYIHQCLFEVLLKVIAVTYDLCQFLIVTRILFAPLLYTLFANHNRIDFLVFNKFAIYLQNM